MAGTASEPLGRRRTAIRGHAARHPFTTGTLVGLIGTLACLGLANVLLLAATDSGAVVVVVLGGFVLVGVAVAVLAPTSLGWVGMVVGGGLCGCVLSLIRIIAMGGLDPEQPMAWLQVPLLSLGLTAALGSVGYALAKAVIPAWRAPESVAGAQAPPDGVAGQLATESEPQPETAEGHGWAPVGAPTGAREWHGARLALWSVVLPAALGAVPVLLLELYSPPPYSESSGAGLLLLVMLPVTGFLAGALCSRPVLVPVAFFSYWVAATIAVSFGVCSGEACGLAASGSVPFAAMLTLILGTGAMALTYLAVRREKNRAIDAAESQANADPAPPPP